MADWEEYFSKQTAPANLEETRRVVSEFAVSHRAAGRNVVLVTSGGTAVPLENNTVRFIDNFSSGTRGSASAEYFLEHGYAVVFLYRQHSLQPFMRSLSPDSLLDIMDIREDRDGSSHIEVDEMRAPNLREILKKYQEVQVMGSLLLVEFNTLSDYLFLLRIMSEVLGSMGPHIMFYLAAAVSDFYIPSDNMSEHKISSDGGPLQLSMQQVPKMLSPLVKEWASNSFVVSFKLETDVNIISKKARQALNRYNHQVVVSNILQTRKKTVVIVTPTQEMAVWMGDGELELGKEIEAKIVLELIKMHQNFIGTGTVIQGAPAPLHLHSQMPLGISTSQVSQFPYGSAQQQQSPSPLTPHEGGTSPVFSTFSSTSTASSVVTHIRLRKGEEITSPNLSPSPIPESAGVPLTPTTPTSHKSSSRFGMLAEPVLNQEMKAFIESFRTRRIALGYTQEDVGYELSRTNGPSYSQSFISRFESKNLGLKAAEKMKPVMQTWIEQKELECAKGLRVCKKRKRRTSFSNEALRLLIGHFEQNPKPTSAEISVIASKLGLEPVTVRVWFCNRKQMLKRMATGKIRVNNSLRAELEAKSRVDLPTSEHSDTKMDFTNMPVGQFSFTEDKVKPLVCLGPDVSPSKPSTRTSTANVTYAQVHDDTIVHSSAPNGGSPVSYAVAFADPHGAHVEHAAVVSLNFEPGGVPKPQQVQFPREIVEESTLHEYASEVQMPES